MRGRNYHPVMPNTEAFAYALKRIREDEHERERAMTKFPELAEFLSAHENLLWELAKVTVKAKGCVLGDCARNLEIFLEDQEKQLDQDESLAPVAYANLTEMIIKMANEARGGGSFVISDANFLASRPDTLFKRG